MFGVKNPTPRQIALFTSFAIGIVVGFLLVALNVFSDNSIELKVILLMASIVVLISYTVIIFSLKRYIYRKIKLIYKTIHRHKLSAEEKQKAVDINTAVMDNVENEVAEWADDREKEIENLKEWQDYRRRFLGDISHELKTPIFNIQGYLETLLDGALYDENINMKYLSKAARNVERLNTIVEDLQSITQLESGELELDLQIFDIRELTQEVFDDLEIKANEKRVDLLFKAGADRGYRVNADRENIRQVLVNLIVNSIKYGNEGGITKIGFYDMENYILVEVADNGIGIDENHLTHLFERFYRVDKSRSREQGGSGLGLSIVKHIIEAHKQTINVRSSENMGSTFGFTLEKA